MTNEFVGSLDGLASKVEDNYHEHQMLYDGAALALLGCVIGGAALKYSAVEEKVAEVGSAEFKALQDPIRSCYESGPALPLKWKALGDDEIFAHPSKTSDASSWDLALPHLDFTSGKVLGNPEGWWGSGEGAQFMNLPDRVSLFKDGWGRLDLMKADSTGKFFGPDNKLAMSLNHLGDELHYDKDGKVIAIGRGVRRMLDPLGHYSQSAAG